MKIRFGLQAVAALCAAVLTSVPARAMDADYLKQLVPVAQNSIKPYGEDMFGDKVSLYDGSLAFEQTDLDLKGNNELPVRLTRGLAVGRRTTTYAYDFPLGQWEWKTPRIGGSFSKTVGWTGYANGVHSDTTRCSAFWRPGEVFVGGQVAFDNDYWHGTYLDVPGAGKQELLKRSADYAGAPTTGGPYPIVTKQQWQVGCLASIKNGSGEGFYAISTSGVRYDFDWMATREVDAIKIGKNAFRRQDMYLMATKVTDRFGNWVTYTYDPADPEKLTSIQSSDGRSITITNSGGHAVSATDGTRTYTYGYTGRGLTSVTLPDGTQWGYQLGGLLPSDNLGLHTSPDTACPDGSNYMRADVFTGSITHPSGATATYTMKYFLLAYADMQAFCNISDGVARYDVMPSRAVIGLSNKVITGAGLTTQAWTYDYLTAGNWPCASGCSNTDITNPDGTRTRQVFGNRYENDQGLLLYVVNGWDGGTSGKQVIAYTYQKGGAGQPFPESFGISYAQFADWNGPLNKPTKTTVITRDGATFSNQVDAFDANARPVALTRSGPGGTRSEATTYYDNTALWVLGQVAEVTSGGYSVQSTDFDSLARPTTSRAFGIVKGSQTYNADGTVATKSDAAGNTATFSNYKRGVAQTVHYPNGGNESGVVNDIGLVTSYTDAAGYSSSFGYDAMGRLASITPPSGFTGTTVTFSGVPTEEYGIPAGHWRQSVSKGNARTVTYFDAMWRPVMSRTWDASDEANTRKVVVKAFDTQNRVTYESYPQRDIASVALRPAGKRTTYDAIGRPTQVDADSELSDVTALSTKTEYLTGFKTRVTNPRGFQTTQTMWALDKPDEASIQTIEAPLGVQVSIVRDAFGKPTSITRGGVTRAYVYDAGQRLCKTIEPEVGATVQDYDLAGNVAWRAPGQALPGTTTCDTASVPASAKIAYGYDAIGQLLTTAYGDGSPGITRTYTPDAKLESIVSNGSTWVYGYNELRQLSSEILNFSGRQFSFAWNHNSAGDLASLVYPNGSTVAYTPNGLGEATTAGSYAAGVSYHPNGAVAGYTLGNGIAHTLTQNKRGLPLVNRDAGVLQDQYSYDENGNVAAIADQQEGVFNRSMGYDALDRLTSANAPGVWGNASYTYDAVDNITSATVGARASSMGYDGRNRLATVMTNGALYQYQYDERGNILSKGAQSYTFDLGNRMGSSNLGGTYQYDGHGRRTWIRNNDGSTRVQVYGQGGQLLWGAADEVQPDVPATIASYSCASGTLSGSQCLTTSTYGATPNGYVCNAGDSLSGTTCTHVTTSNYGASVASWSCNAGDSLSGSTCSHTYVANTYGASPVYACNAGDSLSGSTCTHVANVAATPVYACPGGYSLSGTTCSRTTTVVATISSYTCNGLGSPNASQQCIGTAIVSADESDQDRCLAANPYSLVFASSSRSGRNITCRFSAQPVYSCPSGGSLSGNQCTSTVTQAATVNSYSCSSGTVSDSSCLIPSNYGASIASWVCNGGDSLSGTTCSQYATSTYGATPSYVCNAGDSLSGSTCTHTASSTYGASVSAWACNAGDSLSGSTCTKTTASNATPNYSCASGTLSGSTCIGGRKQSETMYVYLAGKQIAEVTGGVTQYPHTDALGSPVAHSSAAGALLNRTRFEPYGFPAAGTKPSKATSVIGFTGHVQDSETNLVYMQQRYYDPIPGRFLSVDPIVTDANTGKGFGLYTYVDNNPYLRVDPDGRQSVNVYPNFSPMEYLKTLAVESAKFIGIASAGAGGTAIQGVEGAAAVVKAAEVAPKAAEAVTSARSVTVTNDSIKAALQGSELQTTQNAISKPVVESYVGRLQAGEAAPAIKVDGKVIVDGNHRYVAGRLVGQEPAQTAGTLSPSQAGKVQPVQNIKIDPSDWGNR